MTTILRSIATALVLLASAALAQSQTLQVEVSEDMNRFAFDQSKTYEDGFPAHGSGFVTQGYVYPSGTLNGSNGVNADGSAEFPELVIGEWICYGYMINDAAHATSGTWVVSTQIINLDREHGAQSIVTTGYEFADDTEAVRAVAGGTGAYAEARGEAVQVFTGLNAPSAAPSGRSQVYSSRRKPATSLSLRWRARARSARITLWKVWTASASRSFTTT